ncbi:MAG: hypothetical protein JWQ98_1056 [Chlorobi bacterium]|nr:hypothetical protein [Chlorobiota bacterium]
MLMYEVLSEAMFEIRALSQDEELPFVFGLAYIMHNIHSRLALVPAGTFTFPEIWQYLTKMIHWQGSDFEAWASGKLRDGGYITSYYTDPLSEGSESKAIHFLLSEAFQEISVITPPNHRAIIRISKLVMEYPIKLYDAINGQGTCDEVFESLRKKAQETGEGEVQWIDAKLEIIRKAEEYRRQNE